MKAHKESHSFSSNKHKSNEFGVGVKNPVGKMKEIMGEKRLQTGKIRKPPKKMA